MNQPYLVALRGNPKMERELRLWASTNSRDHWKLDFTQFEGLQCRDIIREVVAHPQWRRLLEMEDDIYGELCVEFFSTFTIFTSKSTFSDPRHKVTFHLGGEWNTLTFDELARSLRVYDGCEAEWEEDAIIVFNMNATF
ncbi:unnamed protein product [Linum trigynum]|uniref:Uncharacterized protein n=1 Tax=Linum trigynum TaxID=586398 RepID=A0AAV2FA99_9ROSI